MNSISISYALVWELKYSPNYQFTKEGKCFNIKSGRQIKQTYCGRSRGFCINGKFNSLTKLRTMLQKIQKKHCPF